MIAAIAAKDAEAAAAAAKDANAEAKAIRENATPKPNPKAQRCPHLRGDITRKDEKRYVFARDVRMMSCAQVGRSTVPATTAEQVAKHM